MVSLKEILTITRVVLMAFGVSEATANSDDVTRIISGAVAVTMGAWSIYESRKHARLKAEVTKPKDETEVTANQN